MLEKIESQWQLQVHAILYHIIMYEVVIYVGYSNIGAFCKFVTMGVTLRHWGDGLVHSCHSTQQFAYKCSTPVRSDHAGMHACYNSGSMMYF